ncbi:MAG: hypothetical protein EOS55_18235 [Mesorhizobium sp.]|nr:MAG: hypothetical protein EOS55_18235 [Mesorhizobium sp.]
MSEPYVESFYRSHRDLADFLIANGQPTFAADANENFRRSLILAIASFFEHEICEIVRSLPARHARGNPFLTELVAQKAVARQYHTYFEWDKPNANKFFSMFGAEYKAASQRKVDEDPDFKTSVQAFLSLGETRNQMVHQNYLQFPLDLSSDDIILKFRQAQRFVEYVRETLLPAEEQEEVAPAAST